MTTTEVIEIPWQYHDGGRADAGFRADAGDCVTRAIAIATGLPYRQVYDELHARAREDEARRRNKTRSGPSPRSGVHRKVYEPYLFDLGWVWVAHMGIGTGCRVHMRHGEVPDEGPLVVALSRHLSAVVEGWVWDTHDPCRGGDRCVYGWYEPGADAVVCDTRWCYA